MPTEQTTTVVDPAVATNTTTEVATTPSVASLKDDDLVEIVVRGETVRKPWKEARAGFQMQEDYTRSKQELSAQAKELKELFDGLKAQKQTVAERELALDRILGRATPQNTPENPKDDDIVAHGEMKRQFETLKKDLMDQFQSTLRGEIEKTTQARQFERFEDLTNTAVDSLLKEHPSLSKIPRLAAVLKLEAAEDKPQTEKDMVAALVKVGKRLAKSLDDDYTERRKEEVTRKQQTLERGPIAEKGVPQYKPIEKSYGPRGKINWDQLEKDIIGQIETLD
jgi:hypothetical protein